MQNWEGTFEGSQHLDLPGYRNRLEMVVENRLSDEACERFYAMLAAAERPLITPAVASSTAMPAKPCGILPKAYQLPVTTTLMALGASDTTHPLSLHMLGMHGIASANYAVEDCDFLIAIRRTIRRSRCR